MNNFGNGDLKSRAIIFYFPLLFFFLISLSRGQNPQVNNFAQMGQITIDPSNTNNLYLPSFFIGVLKSSDGGANWYSSTTGIQGHGVRSIAVNPFNSNYVLATVWEGNNAMPGTGLGVFKSTNGGYSWSASTSGMVSGLDLAPIAFDPKTQGVVYTGGYYGTFYKSTDAGETWTSNNMCCDINYILVTSNGEVWTSGWGGIFSSSDGGSNWVDRGLPISPRILMAKTNSNILVASVPGTIYRTTNAGTSWQEITGDIGEKQMALWCDENKVCAVSNKGFYYTTDGGSHWMPIDTTQYVLSYADVVQIGNDLMGWGGAFFKITGLITSINENPTNIPQLILLGQNYPNPFNPSTSIEYQIAKQGNVEVAIYDINGRLIKILLNSTQYPGSYTIQWNGQDEGNRAVASGTYFYQVKSNGIQLVKKMLLMK